MKISPSLKALVIAAIIALTLFAQQGTAWAGISWDRDPDGPGGASWE